MLKNEKGYALVLVLIIMIIFFMLGTALIAVSTSQVKEAVKQQERVQAYYLAYSGANAVAEWVMSGNDVPEGESEVVELDTGSFFVDVVENGNQLIITSHGTVDGFTETVSVTLSKESGNGFLFPPDMALFSNDTINMPNGTIIGSIGTNATESNSIHLSGGASISGEIWVGPGASEDILDVAHYIDVSEPQELNEPSNYEMPDFPDYPTDYPVYPDTTISCCPSNSHKIVDNGKLNGNHWLLQNYNTIDLHGDYEFTEIIMTNDYEIFFDLGGGDRNIVVGHLNLSNGHISLIGGGSLTIYVKDQISFGSASLLNAKNNIGTQSDIDRLNIFYKGDNPISLTGGQKVHGSLYSVSELANLHFGNGSGFYGNVVTGGSNVYLDGGTEAVVRVLYAPNSHVNLGGGAALKGTIIANSFEMSGGAKVIYDDAINDIDLPFLDRDGEVDSENWGNPYWSGD